MMLLWSEGAAKRAAKRGRHGRRKGAGAGAPAHAHGRVLRRGRIFARLREGWAYDEIAAMSG